jgi:hypothetical protein
VVFKTIAENIKSFFEREESLEKEPKKVPDAAVELFERPHAQGEKIVEHSLGKQSQQPKTPSQKLPFSSSQLRQRLATQQAPPSPKQHEKAPEQIEVSEDISSQIMEFEQALTSMPGAEDSEHTSQQQSSRPAPLPATPVEKRPKEKNPTATAEKLPPSYFDKLSTQLKEGDVGSLKDSLDRMKEHHASHSAKEEHVAKAGELEQQLTAKLAELQGLEREWSSKVAEAEAAGNRITELESLISERTDGLRSLVLSIKEHGEKQPQLPSPSTATSESAKTAAETSSLDEKNPVQTAGERKASSAEIPAKNELFHKSKEDLFDEVTPVGNELFENKEERDEQPAMGLPPSPDAVIPDARALDEPEDRSFVLNDGRKLMTIGDLREALSSMDDALFYHHVRQDRNDFAAWVEGVFNESALAARLVHARNRMDMVQVLADQ